MADERHTGAHRGQSPAHRLTAWAAVGVAGISAGVVAAVVLTIVASILYVIGCAFHG